MVDRQQSSAPTVTEGLTEPSSMEPLPSRAPAGEDLAVDELLVEDVSIDGMCGVY
jgi:mycofactocin precursor